MQRFLPFLDKNTNIIIQSTISVWSLWCFAMQSLKILGSFLFNWKQCSLFLFMDMKVIDMSCLRAHYLQQQYYNAFAFCSGLSITQGMTRLHKVKLYKTKCRVIFCAFWKQKYSYQEQTQRKNMILCRNSEQRPQNRSTSFSKLDKKDGILWGKKRKMYRIQISSIQTTVVFFFFKKKKITAKLLLYRCKHLSPW